MNWSIVIQGASAVLCLILIARLLTLKLHRVYTVFCIFLAYELFSSFVAFVEGVIHNSLPGHQSTNPFLDYRLIWVIMRPIAWVLSLWMVYSLLGASLERLTGILRYSRRILNIVFFLAIGAALVIARSGDLFTGVDSYKTQIEKTVIVSFVLERVIAMVAVLVLISILSFILWFPVEMPKNLTVFSFGYVFYFTVKTGLLLSQSYWSHQVSRNVGTLIMGVLACCFAYWIAFINPEGETREVQIGHSWNTGEQPRYLGQLEAINAALLRSARR